MNIRRLTQCLAMLALLFACNTVFADTLTPGSVTFLGEESSDPVSSSQLRFRIDDPRVSNRYRYLDKSHIEFTLNADNRGIRYGLLLNSSWLASRNYGSPGLNPVGSSVYMGRRKLSSKEIFLLKSFTDPEMMALVWVITHADELIHEAVHSAGTNMPKVSANRWKELLLYQNFEDKLRNNFKTSKSVNEFIKFSDRASLHSERKLKEVIQPALTKLGFYQGKIDGLIGPATTKAIKNFERSVSIFPDGVLKNLKELNLLKREVKAKSQAQQWRLDTTAMSISRPYFRLQASHFPDETIPEKNQNIIAVVDVKTANINEFKLNGHLNLLSNKIYANDFCLHNKGWGTTKDNVCFPVSFNGAGVKLAKHLTRLSNVDILKERSKCDLVANRYTELLTASAKNGLVQRLLKTKRTEYIHAANQCVKFIDYFLNREQTKAEKTANTSGTTTQLERQLKAVESLYQKSGKTNIELRSQISTMQSDISELKASIKEWRTKYIRRNAEIRALSSKVADKGSDQDSEVQALKLKINGLKAELNRLETLTKKQGEKAKELSSTVTAKNNEINAHNATVRRLQDNSILQLDLIEKLENEIATHVRESNNQNITATELEDELTQKIVELVTVRKALETKIELLNKNLNSSNEKNIIMKQALNALNQEVTASLAVRKKLETEIETLNNQLKKQSSQIAVAPKGFEVSEEWAQYKQWITPSQMRFCSILYDYEIEKQKSASSGNQLLQNLAIKTRDSDIAALLSSSRNSDGGFRSWVSVVDSVFAMDVKNPKTNRIELAAGVILKTPCNNTLGTGRVVDNIGNPTSEFKYLAFEGDVIFSQLASLRRGDPVLFDG